MMVNRRKEPLHRQMQGLQAVVKGRTLTNAIVPQPASSYKRKIGVNEKSECKANLNGHHSH